MASWFRLDRELAGVLVLDGITVVLELDVVAVVVEVDAVAVVVSDGG